MAGSKTQYLSKKLMDLMLGGTSFTPPATFYVALSTAAFDPTVTGSAMNEIATASYARKSLTNNTTNFPSASDAVPSVKAVVGDIVFATAGEDWGTPLSIYLCDAATLGNALYGCDLAASSDIASGSAFRIVDGTLIFSED